MRISFDFDGTLEDDFDGTINKQKLEIQNLAKKYISDGHEVFIITKRYNKDNYRLGLGNEHLKVYSLANDLGIDNVYFTNREMKFSHIIGLNINIHFENDSYEVDIINQVCKERLINCLVVDVENNTNWRDLL